MVPNGERQCLKHHHVCEKRVGVAHSNIRSPQGPHEDRQKRCTLVHICSWRGRSCDAPSSELTDEFSGLPNEVPSFYANENQYLGKDTGPKTLWHRINLYVTSALINLLFLSQLNVAWMRCIYESERYKRDRNSPRIYGQTVLECSVQEGVWDWLRGVLSAYLPTYGQEIYSQFPL
jgi:hypothetical protein